MGVYVYVSLHMNALKIGHYSKQNAWCRVAHRGFYSCVCPSDIHGRVGVDDVELIAWFPKLTSKDEKKIHKALKEYAICGEWFRGEAFSKFSELVKDENKMVECSKEAALATRARL